MPSSRSPQDGPGDPAANGYGHWSSNGRVAVLGDAGQLTDPEIRDGEFEGDLNGDFLDGDLDEDLEPLVPLDVEREELERLERLGGFTPDLDDRVERAAVAWPEPSGRANGSPLAGRAPAPGIAWPAPGDGRSAPGVAPPDPWQAPERDDPEQAPVRTPTLLPGRVAALVLFTAVVMLGSIVVTVVNGQGEAGAAGAAGTAVAVVAPDARPDVVRHWNAVTLQTLGEDGTAPTVSARALAMVHTSMYDAWAAYDGQALGTQLGDRLRRPISERTDANKQAAISYAAYTALADLFPGQARPLQAELRHLGYDPAVEETDPATPAGVGRAAAAEVLAFRHHDGANQLGDLAPGAYADYTGYQPVNPAGALRDPARWQPLNLPRRSGEEEQEFVTPHWARVAPFALTAADQFRPVGPPAPGSSDRQREIAELTRLSAELDDSGKAVVEFWADASGDDTPAAQWARFGQWVSQRDRLSMDDEVKLFFALANAALDATVVAWDAKATFDSARPVSVIGAGLGGTEIEAWAGPYQASRWIRASDWRPYQPATTVTPPSPGYVSAQSAVGAASAAILRSFTGSDAFGASATVRAGESTVEPGVVPYQDITLSWPTFTAAVEESVFSRLLAGTHFASSTEHGHAAGTQAGAQVWAKAQALFDGTAAVNPV